MRRAVAVAALSALSCALSSTDAPGPALTRVEPAEVAYLSPTRILLRGERLSAAVIADLDRPASSTVEPTFSAALLANDKVLPLESVARVDDTLVEAVVPAGLPLGDYAVRLTDARGKVTSLEDAVRVRTPECPQALGRPCVVAGACADEDALQPGLPCHSCRPDLSRTGWSPSREGARCEDGNACTLGETCRAGVCGAPTGTVACLATDCHGAGECDAKGRCPAPAPNGTPCDDGDACTRAETCQEGTCGRPGQVTACAPTACEASARCDPATGACVATARPDGAACEDQDVCTGDDRCLAGQCRGAARCGNTAPRACLRVTPTASVAGARVRFDARCSTDAEDLPSTLAARFDFQGDGVFDTAFGPLEAEGVLAAPGLYTAKVEVRDAAGLLGTAAKLVAVASAADDLLVTTAADERDVGATAQVPRGTGLSLREAIELANAAGAPKQIRFLGPMTIKASALPPLTAVGARIVAERGVVLDFSTTTQPSEACLTLGGAGQLVAGATVRRCRGPAVLLQGAGGQLAECALEGGASRGSGEGVVVTGALARIGPLNDLAGFSAAAVVLKATGAWVGQNVIHHCQRGVDVGSSPFTLVELNDFHRQAGAAVSAQAARGLTLRHNTLYDNGAGLEALPSARELVLRNNVLQAQHGPAVSGRPESFTSAGPNLFFGNGQGDLPMAAADAGVRADARFRGPDAGDFRLVPTSPAVNAGVNLSLDVNGTLPGLFSGSAPDLGAHEAR